MRQHVLKEPPAGHRARQGSCPLLQRSPGVSLHKVRVSRKRSAVELIFVIRLVRQNDICNMDFGRWSCFLLGHMASFSSCRRIIPAVAQCKSNPFPFAQNKLLHLARRGLGQIAEVHRGRALEMRDLLAAECNYLFLRTSIPNGNPMTKICSMTDSMSWGMVGAGTGGAALRGRTIRFMTMKAPNPYRSAPAMA
jgi:hypothetical protein